MIKYLRLLLFIILLYYTISGIKNITSSEAEASSTDALTITSTVTANKQPNNLQLKKSLDFIPIPKKATIEQILTMIKNDYITKINSKLNGMFHDNNNVLDTYTISQRYNIPFDSAEMIIKEGFDKNKKSWIKFCKKIEAEYFSKIRDNLEEINSAKDYLNELNEVFTSWDYTAKTIKTLEQQFDINKKFFDTKQTIHSLYCLTFTLSLSEDRERNYVFIKKRSDNLAQNKVLTEGLLKKSLNKFILVDKFYNSALRSSFDMKVSLDSYNFYFFRPSVYYGKLSKFKIDLIEQNYPSKHPKLSLIDSKIAKTFVIVSGNEFFDINNKICTNVEAIQKECLQRWLSIFNKYPNVLWSSEQKNKTQAMINEVIKDNCESQIEKLTILKEKRMKLNSIKNRIDIEKNKINNIKNQMRIYGIDEKYSNKPNDNIASLFRKYSEIYYNAIKEKIESLESLLQKKPVISHVLIEGTYKIDKVEKNINSEIDQLESKFSTFCSDHSVYNWGDQLFSNRQIVNNEQFAHTVVPVITGYSIPQVMLLDHYLSDFFYCAVPVFLKIDCVSLINKFVYHEYINAIEDKSTHYFWKISSIHPRILKRKHISENDFQYPSSSDKVSVFEEYFLDYQDFCTSYEKYRQSWPQINDLPEIILPEIKCIQRYEIIDEYTFNDNLRLDQWKIIKQSTYPNFANYSNDSDWTINTYESLQRLFLELKQALNKNQVDMKIIQMLSNQSFWTNTQIDYGYKSVVVFDFTKNFLSELTKSTDEMFMGILKRNFDISQTTKPQFLSSKPIMKGETKTVEKRSMESESSKSTNPNIPMNHHKKENFYQNFGYINFNISFPQKLSLPEDIAYITFLNKKSEKNELLVSPIKRINQRFYFYMPENCNRNVSYLLSKDMDVIAAYNLKTKELHSIKLIENMFIKEDQYYLQKVGKIWSLKDYQYRYDPVYFVLPEETVIFKNTIRTIWNESIQYTKTVIYDSNNYLFEIKENKLTKYCEFIANDTNFKQKINLKLKKWILFDGYMNSNILISLRQTPLFQEIVSLHQPKIESIDGNISKNVSHINLVAPSRLRSNLIEILLNLPADNRDKWEMHIFIENSAQGRITDFDRAMIQNISKIKKKITDTGILRLCLWECIEKPPNEITFYKSLIESISNETNYKVKYNILTNSHNFNQLREEMFRSFY